MAKTPAIRKRIKRRKPVEDRKQHLIQIRVTAEQRQRLNKAANDRGLDLSSWLRMIALQAATEAEQDS
jgi:uncharacterized protein (DUF1778 family)